MSTDAKSVLMVVTTYNRKQLLDRALTSILKAKPAKFNISILVVDDASADGTREYLEQYAESDNIFSIQLAENSGVNKARQAGLDWCLNHNYCWLSFMDDDDYLTEDCFENLATVMDEQPNEAWIALSASGEQGEKISKFPSAGRYNYLIDYMGKRSVRGDFQSFFVADKAKGLSFSNLFKNGEVWYFWCHLGAKVDMYIPGLNGVVKEYLEGGITKSNFNRDKRYKVSKYKVGTLKRIMPSKYYAKILYNYGNICYKKGFYIKALAVCKKSIRLNKFILKNYLLFFRILFSIKVLS